MHPSVYQRVEKLADLPRIILILILIACTALVSGEPGNGGDPGLSYSRTADPGILRLSVRHQKMAGIVTQVIHPTDFLPETRAFANVLSLDPLLDLGAQLQAAASDRKIAGAALTASKTAFRQVQDLFNDKAVARFEYEQSKMEWLSASARYDQAVSRADSIRLKAAQNWGTVLAEWVMHQNGPEFKSLIRRKSVLLAVSLRPGEILPEGTHIVFVHRSADRSSATPAELISSAPTTAEKSQGERYFFWTAADAFRSGMHLYVWIPLPGKKRKGVEIPAKALVWRDGKPWIYRKIAPETFLRRAVESAIDYSDRWFIPDAPDESAEIVVSGGQMLLSQEFHWQIPDEEDD